MNDICLANQSRPHKHADMRYPTILLSCLAMIGAVGAETPGADGAEWNLVQAYQASTQVFYGEIAKILPSTHFKVGAAGVPIKEIDEQPMRLEPLVWPKAKELSFTVEEPFKQPLPDSFAVYVADPHPDLWTHVTTDAGDVLLVKPVMPDPLFGKLQPGDRGLFFVRAYPGSNVPVLHAVRLGKQALDDLALLRAHRRQPGQSLAAIVGRAQAQAAAIARQEAAEFKEFEDDYYKILRIQDLDIRASLLQDLVERMGFEGRWTYYAFKERYLEAHGAHTPDSAVPAGPTEGKEKLWHDISGELRKIEVIQKARGSAK